MDLEIWELKWTKAEIALIKAMMNGIVDWTEMKERKRRRGVVGGGEGGFM
jgi:hypothetical protein